MPFLISIKRKTFSIAAFPTKTEFHYFLTKQDNILLEIDFLTKTAGNC